MATPPANRNGSHSSLPTIPAEPFVIGLIIYSAAGSAADSVSGDHNDSDQEVSRNDLDGIECERPSTRQGYDPP